MVYGGRPSRGCRTCRARRIKCDEGKPTCRRCAKSNRECGGYRPEFEIVHRDQTRSTVRRLRSVADVVQRQFTSARPLVFVQEQPHTWSRRSSGPAPVLTVPVAERAACNFAANFILMPRSVGPHGFMEYLVPLIEAEPDGSALRHAFNACAFALLGNRARADRLDLAQLSLKEHTLALGQTNKALSHAAVARTDSTLAAVLLLCLYESITAIKETRMLAWRSHIDGAVNLVNARGREQLCRTRMGTLLFSAVRHQLVSRTLSSVVPLPLGADFWMSAGDNESLLATSQRFALRYTELRAESSRLLANSARSPESVEQINDLAARLRNFDCDIASWLRSIPDELRFRTLCWVSQDDLDFSNGRDYGQVEAFPGRVDVYPDFVTTSAWNIGRVSRILVVSLAIRLTAWLCSPVDYRTTPDYETFRRICESLISEIIASVPYQLGWHKKRKEFSGNMPALSGFACGDEGPCKALPCSFLVWPLICVKNHDICSEEQRAWAKGRLQFIADQVGLKYASAVLAVHLRFPSMLIRRDGVMTTPVALQGSSRSDLPPRPAADPAPLTPEKSPSPG